MLSKRNISPVFLFFIIMMAFYSGISSAGSYPLQEKLEQCKKEFALSHQKDATQETAAAARLKHLQLMQEILTELNKKNANKKLTDEQLQENVMVMSHLLEMLVAENLAEKQRTWNLNY